MKYVWILICFETDAEIICDFEYFKLELIKF